MIVKESCVNYNNQLTQVLYEICKSRRFFLSTNSQYEGKCGTSSFSKAM